MITVESHRLGLQQGSLVLFSDFQDGGTMWTGDGPRELRKAVRFPEPFRGKPMVHVSLSMWDVDGEHNSRMDISSDGVTSEGFVIVFRTWGDTRVARVRADWMAMGGVGHEDDWDIP
ncbi:MAG: H-type lectin domain-containing protein [Clostridia bacterium]|jgi:H-type lectin domain.|uniref:H-type lectin domain-containing protein n=1 Tax=Thioclava TaxID=285107 RepID=UPI000996EF1C|nr:MULTISPECIES: H-type lectin domain-containing protein [Thioclava]MBC7336688.1 H-type lectin domain-containing protein [Clostridia bacterium]TNE93669.1 MAG: hypothetical protein EP337_02745 [Paracoccaceae bacterium]MBC7144816.1 H-type lectin domain-containing protein [Thioclava marina]MBD3802082.1 H-type lectin domain-containing protein [Thioclava sp.]OOY27146.1 hypothetical protein BMI90_13670 [Thioclava sp. L04-15]